MYGYNDHPLFRCEDEADSEDEQSGNEETVTPPPKKTTGSVSNAQRKRKHGQAIPFQRGVLSAVQISSLATTDGTRVEYQKYKKAFVGKYGNDATQWTREKIEEWLATYYDETKNEGYLYKPCAAMRQLCIENHVADLYAGSLLIPNLRKAQMKNGQASTKVRKDWTTDHVVCLNMETKSSLDEKACATFAGLQKFIFCGVVALCWSSWRRCNAVLELLFDDIEVEPYPLSPTNWVFKTRFRCDKEIQSGKPLYLCTAPTIESQPACCALQMAEHIIVLDAALSRLYADAAPNVVSAAGYNALLDQDFSAFVCERKLFPSKVELSGGADVPCNFAEAVEYSQFKNFLETTCKDFQLPLVQIHGARGGGGTHGRKVGLNGLDISARGNWQTYANMMRYQQYSVADECKTSVWLASGREPEVAPPQEGLMPYKQVTKVLFDSPQVTHYGKVITAARQLFQDAYGVPAPSGATVVDRIRAIVNLHSKAKRALSAGLATTSTFKIAAWDEASLAACIASVGTGANPGDFAVAVQNYLSTPRVKPATTGVMEQKKLSDYIAFKMPSSATPAPLMPDAAVPSKQSRVVAPKVKEVELAALPTLKMVKFSEVKTLFEEGLSMPGNVRTPPLKDYSSISNRFKKTGTVRTMMCKYRKIYKAMTDYQIAKDCDWISTVRYFDKEYKTLSKCYNVLDKEKGEGTT